MVSDGRMPSGQVISAKKLAACRAQPHVHMTIERARVIRARFDEVGVIAHVAKEFGLST